MNNKTHELISIPTSQKPKL